MTQHRVCCLRAALALTLRKYLILQTALGLHHTFTLGIGLQKIPSFCNGLLGLLFLLLLEILAEQFLCLTARHGWSLAGQYVAHALAKVLHREVLDAHALELLSDAKTQCITDFVHTRLLTIYTYYIYQWRKITIFSPTHGLTRFFFSYFCKRQKGLGHENSDTDWCWHECGKWNQHIP